MSRTLPALLFSTLFTLPQAFSNYHWPKSAGEVKDCLSLPRPQAWGPSGEICQCQSHYWAQGEGQQCESAQEVRADAWFSLRIIGSLWITGEGPCKSCLAMSNIKTPLMLFGGFMGFP